MTLATLLEVRNSPTTAIDPGFNQEVLRHFKEHQERIMVATASFGHNIDIERINSAINYDMLDDGVSYLFALLKIVLTASALKVLLSFVADDGDDVAVMEIVQEPFVENMTPLAQKSSAVSELT